VWFSSHPAPVKNSRTEDFGIPDVLPRSVLDAPPLFPFQSPTTLSVPSCPPVGKWAGLALMLGHRSTLLGWAGHIQQFILCGRGQQARASFVLRPPLRSTCGRHSPRQGVYTLASLLGTRPAWLPGFLVPRCRVVSWAGQTTA
jgi:hypothetical protein